MFNKEPQGADFAGYGISELDHKNIPYITEYTDQDEKFASKMHMLYSPDNPIFKDGNLPEETTINCNDLKKQLENEMEKTYQREVRPKEEPARKNRDAKNN